METNKVEKMRTISKKKADATKDIDLINQYTLTPLDPDGVFVFSVILCDNDIDRDLEQFTDKTLKGFRNLFVGKTVITDHYRSAENQFARLYHVELVGTGKKNAVGQPLKQLRGSAYVPRTEDTEETIKKIEAGILKEVSVGCRVGKAACSICGEDVRWWGECKEGHQKGQMYDGQLCYTKLEDAIDAYECSFVAVPAQRGAGVIKSHDDILKAFEILSTVDLSDYSDQLEEFEKKLGQVKIPIEEKQKREAIRQDVLRKYLNKEGN